MLGQGISEFLELDRSQALDIGAEDGEIVHAVLVDVGHQGVCQVPEFTRAVSQHIVREFEH